MTETSADASPIRILDGCVLLQSLEVRDPSVRAFLERVPVDERAAAVHRMLGIGARALVETAVGVDLAAIDEHVLLTIERATGAAESRVRAIMSEAEAAMRSSLDPDTRTSVMSRALSELETVRVSITEAVDPTRADSHVSGLLRSLTTMLGPGGDLDARLQTALDPATEGSALAAFRRDVDRRFTELRELLAEQRGRREEAEAGTRKGFDFEDVVEERLRSLARPLGAIVTRTSNEVGAVADCLVGDLVVTLADGTAVVIEAKNSGRVGLDGAGGILAELDTALANRGATVAICVSAADAFPAEVGPFGVYGNRILVVDDGEGPMIEVALRWATLLASASQRAGAGIDLDRVHELTDRLRRVSRSFSTHRRTLTDSIEAIGRVREGLDDMRRDLLGQIDEIEFELDRRPAAAELRVVNGQ